MLYCNDIVSVENDVINLTGRLCKLHLEFKRYLKENNVFLDHVDNESRCPSLRDYVWTLRSNLQELSERIDKVLKTTQTDYVGGKVFI